MKTNDLRNLRKPCFIEIREIKFTRKNGFLPTREIKFWRKFLSLSYKKRPVELYILTLA